MSNGLIGVFRISKRVCYTKLMCVVLACFFSAIARAEIQLTAEEQAYLTQHPIIKIANDPDWEPFEFVDEDGQLAGVVADYVQLFEQKLGVKFDYVPNRPWSELKDLVKTGERPVVMARHATDERKQYLNFTKAYMSFPVVIVGREKEAYVGSAHELSSRVVAGVKGFNATEYLRQHYPEVTILDVSSIHEGLRAVLTHRADAVVANLGSANYAIKRHGLDGLQIIGQLDINADLAIGVHKNEPILFSILQKALADVSPVQAQIIYDKWFQLRTVKALDQRQLLRLSFYALAVFSLLLLLILWSRYQQSKQQRYINQINEYSYATLIDLDSMTIQWASKSYARLVGCPIESLQGKSVIDLIGSAFSAERLALIESLLRSGQSWTGECEGIGCDGQPFWTLVTLTPHKDWRGRVTQVWATRIDITDKKRIEQLSIVDELTGLYNRRQFNLIVDQEIRRAQREHHTLCLATFDIDFFKLINDVYGHQQGDEALKALANVLKAHFNRANDHVFRMGGEEFMLLTSCDCVDGFIAHLESLRQAVFDLQIPNELAPLKVMTLSIGACYWRDLNSMNVDTMYHHVDQCLYRAKAEGRNRLVMCKQAG